MSRHDDSVSLRQMLDYGREALELIAGKTREEVLSDRIRCLALLQLLQTVGEASRRVPAARQQQLPQIPWPQICAFRNRIAHGYDAVDYDAVWGILSKDLPELVAVLEKVVA